MAKQSNATQSVRHSKVSARYRRLRTVQTARIKVRTPTGGTAVPYYAAAIRYGEGLRSGVGRTSTAERYGFDSGIL